MQRAGVVRRAFAVLAAVSLCASAGCGDDDETNQNQSPAMGSDASTADGGASAAEGGVAVLRPGCERMINEDACDRARRPIVFVHGTSANADSFAHPAMLLASNGYCSDRIRGLEYNSLISRSDAGAGDGGVTLPSGLDGGALDAGIPPAAGDGGAGDGGFPAGFNLNANYMRAKAAIDEAIEQLRKETNVDKVDLLGHSQGSGHASRYARENPDKIASYVHLAGGPLDSNPGGVPTLCLSSTGDRPVTCGTTKNVIIQDETVDHSAVSSSTEAFIEIYKFYNNDAAPKYTTIQCGDPIVLEGRAPTLGDNTFLPGSKIEVYETPTEASQARTPRTPVAVFNLGADGKFGPWTAKPDVQYEFNLLPPPGDTLRTRKIHAYFRPFVRSNRLMRFNMQTADPSAAATGNSLNLHDNHAILIPRRLQKAFLYPRDSLKINDQEVISAANTINSMTGRSATVAAMYLEDAQLPGAAQGTPGDGMYSGQVLGSGAFVRVVDTFIPAAPPGFVKVEFYEATSMVRSTLRIPNWPSASEGVSVVFVD